MLTCGQTYYLFVGTYTKTGSKGIYVYHFNAATGKAEHISNTEGVINPSYVAIAPNNKYIYAVTESGGSLGPDGQQPGSVSAFTFDRSSGQLSFINKQPSGGDNPCYVTVSKNNRWVLAGNYMGGSLSAFQVDADGRLQPFSQLIEHTGKSVNERRQEKPHVHATVLSPAEDYVFVPDLGIDRVHIYKFNPASNKPLQPGRPPFVASTPGSGPRHFTFHPNKKHAYLIEELSGTVVAYAHTDGRLSFKQRISTHPADYKGIIGSADIHTSPDGKFLYASNRGDANSLTIFSIDAKTGRLSLQGHQSTLGVTPRNFTLDPSGNYLLVANQGTNNVVIFKRNQQTGLLRATGQQLSVPTPSCLKMMK